MNAAGIAETPIAIPAQNNTQPNRYIVLIKLFIISFRLTIGGGRGIRTLDTLASKPPFQGGAIDH